MLKIKSKIYCCYLSSFFSHYSLIPLKEQYIFRVKKKTPFSQSHGTTTCNPILSLCLSFLLYPPCVWFTLAAWLKHCLSWNAFLILPPLLCDLNVPSPLTPHVSLCCFVCSVLCAVLSCFSRVQICATPWAVAHWTSLSMRFSRQEYWSWLPGPPPGDLPNPGIGLVYHYVSCVSRWVFFSFFFYH